jgi:pyridoxine 4-oxidase
MDGADVLIIGAGSSGSILANRLSADPACRVTVLEAGGRITDPDVARPELWPFIQGRDYDWAYRTVDQPMLDGRSLEWARGKGFGGSSNLHAMAHMRGARDDFARWVDATGSDRWSWDGLLPYFRGLEHVSTGADAIHSGSGPVPVLTPDSSLSSPLVLSYLDAWESLGVQRIPHHNSGEMIGATPNSLTIEHGRRVTVADAYLYPVLGRPNLTVFDRANVRRLVVTNSRVSGVEFTRNGSDELVEAATVILAAGSIGDPLLLMRSGIGDPSVLAAADVRPVLDRYEVGRNLHDHLLGAGNLYRSRQRVPPTRLQLSESMTYLSAGGAAVHSGRADVVVGCVVGPSVSERFAPVAAALNDGQAYTLLFGVTHPTSRGRLRITGPDPDDPVEIDPAYLTTEEDRANFRTAFTLAREVGRSPAMDAWRAEELLPGPSVEDARSADAFIARAAITHHHPVGTCRMGSDDGAVVDADLKFNGLDNLYVVDASVFPSITTGPVHAAVMAVAESFALQAREPESESNN